MLTLYEFLLMNMPSIMSFYSSDQLYHPIHKTDDNSYESGLIALDFQEI